MWKIVNTKNIEQLKKFKAFVIDPLFEEILYYKEMYFSAAYDSTTNKIGLNIFISDKYLLKSPTNHSIILFLFKQKYKHTLFIDCIESLTQSYTLVELYHYYFIYIWQNYELNTNSHSIYVENIPTELNTIFSKFFYEKLFNSLSLWKKIDSTGFDRKQFHNNFLTDNQLSVCPYCDIDTITGLGNKQIEHFWPRSEFPFLSMNPNNLISSCHSCNMPEEGKGTKFYNDIYTPYITQIGDHVNFTLDPKNKTVIISPLDPQTDHYLDLLNLKARYKSEGVYKSLKNKGESIFSTILDIETRTGNLMDTSELQSYINKKNNETAKYSPYYFATRDIYANFHLYQNYRKSY